MLTSRKPVAWKFRFNKGPWLLTSKPAKSDKKNRLEVVPLYPHPDPRKVEVTEEMVRRFISCFWREFPEDERTKEWQEWAEGVSRAALAAALEADRHD